MKTKIKIALTLTFTLFALVFYTPKGNTQTQVETAGQKFKSIKVLNDMPADQMGKVMNMMSASLGVNCAFCHTSNDGDYEKEGNEHKDEARNMLKMTFEMNKNYFNNRPEINCNSCHQGKSHPQPTFPLKPVPVEDRPAQPATKPTIDQILDKYLVAVGGKQNLDKVTSRLIKASRIEPNGTTEPEEVWQKSNKLRVETKYGNYVVAEAYDGTNVWKRGNSDVIELKPDEAEQIKREAELFASGNLKAIYPKMDIGNLDRIDGKDVYSVRATTVNNLRERLYFDANTGFLVRRIASTPTILGNFQYQVDYIDYTDFGGVKLPTTINFAVPNIRWKRKILEVKNNVSIDDAKFAK